jgi:transcriptional regulator with XRE-family HTH domain
MLGNKARSLEAAFGIALRRLRLAAGLSQEQLALEAGIQRNFVSLIELGHNQPTLATMAKLALALGVTASGLVAEAEAELAPGRAKTRK